MAIKVGGTEIVSNSRELKNIATIDSGTVTAFNSALNTDPTKGTLTKTFAQNETAEITLSSNVTVGPVVSATKEVPQTGISSKGAWDVNSTASNYDFHNTAANVTLTPTTTNSFSYPDTGSIVDTYTVSGYTMKISSDGTKMYLLSASNNSVQVYNFQSGYEYDLDYVSIDTGNTLSGLSGIFSVEVNSDGTKVFVNSSTIGYMYTLSTAHDLTTATLSSQVTFSNITNLGNMGTVPVARFNSDGTKMFIASSTNSGIYEIDLSTAYDVTTASHSSGFINVYSIDSTPFGMDFNAEGSRLVFGGASNNRYYEFTLSTNFDLSTASHNSSNGRAVGNNYYRVAIANNFLYAYDGTQIARYQGTALTSNALALGSGSFASTDVGKRIVGNGGDVVLTATNGAFTTTGGSAFTDNSTIAAGSWSMFGLKSAGDASGITITSGSGSGSVDIDQASETSNTYNFSGTTSQGIDVTFKPDGTKMYIADYNGNSLLEFNLSTAWDLTTASYVQEYAWNSSSYGTSTTSVAFKTDGTSFYILNYGDDKLIQISLSTAWSLSGASVLAAQTVSNSSWGSVSNPIGLVFSPDGTKIYMNGNTGSKTVQINLTSAWNISGGKTVAHTFSTSNQLTGPTALALNSDGTKIFIAEETNQSRIHQYSLSTAYDLSTISYDNKTLRTAASSTFNGTLYGTYYRPDTDIFYGVAYGAYTVNEFSLQSFIQPTAQYNVAVTNTSGRIDSQYFTDINSMTAAESAGTGTAHYAVSTDGRTTWSVAKGTSGVRPIVRNNSGTWQYNNHSSTQGYGTTGISDDSKTFNPSSQHSNPLGITFKPDGTKMYLCSSGSTDITEYNLSTAWDVSTASYNNVSFSHSGLTDLIELEFNNDGTELYALSSGYPALWRIDLSTAYDLSSASFANSAAVQLNTSNVGSVTNPYCFTWKPDGTAVFIYDYNSSPRYVKRYNLSTAWDLTTASITASSQWLDHSSQTGTAYCMYFNSTGTQIWIGASTHNIYEYTLSTAYDLSTASYTATASLTDDMIGFYIKPDGTKLYAVDNDNNIIRQYSMGLTNLYSTSTTWANGTVNDELYTLQQALSVSSNRMDKTQLDAIPDANHFTLGNSLDLMIALRMNTAASTLPTSDGVTLNYDANALNEGAVLGTDYDFFHPAANKVQIKSLAAQNLKIRVV